MRLNVNMIYERLKRKYPVTMYGGEVTEMVLQYPELFIDNTMHLYSGHVYLATVEHLPQRPVIEKDVILICIGENVRLSYYKEHASVLLIKKKVDFFQVYKSVQNIYELFYEWESRLLALFMGSSDIQDVLECSYPVFECPMYVLDDSFQFAASVCPTKNSRQNLENQTKETLEFQLFLDFLKENEPDMDSHGAFLLKFDAGNFLCVNLFNANDHYIGCLYIDQSDHTYINGEDWLAEYLANIIQRVAEAAPSLLQNEHSSLREILQLIMNEMPLSQNQRILLKYFNHKRKYVSISIHSLKHFSSLPVRYICSALESELPESILFEQDNTIFGLIPLDIFSIEDSASKELDRIISPLILEMHLCAGQSNPFTDLYMLRTYYLQAEAAIENGRLYKPEQNLYCFSEFTLHEMIANSLGGFPIEVYFPQGFDSLLTHDSNGGVSYLETLSAFLEENMSYAATARRLYIHRSTLIERIGRIESELSLNLNNSDHRLLLQILLKALCLEKWLEKQPV